MLGVADAEQLFEAVEAIIARDPAEALRAAARLAESGRDSGQVLRDLEVHGRELLTVQILGDIPPELRVTPDRDRRLLEQAQSLSPTDAIRLLDLISAALDATANGAQARIQLELVLIKAAAPEMDPSIEALMSASSGWRRPSRRVQRFARSLPRQIRWAMGRRRPGRHRLTRSSRGLGSRPRTPAPPRRRRPRRRRRLRRPGRGGHAAPQAAPAASADGRSTSTPPSPPGPRSSTWSAGRNVMLAALLADARPVAVGDREMTIAFPTGAAFLKRKAEQDDYRRMTAEALRTVTGSGLALRYELRAEDETPTAPGAPGLSGEELVRRFLEEFDAEELLDDEPDEGEAT